MKTAKIKTISLPEIVCIASKFIKGERETEEERKKETETDRDRQTETDRDRQTETDRDRQT